MAFATLVLTVPVGALARLEVTKHWTVAVQPGAGTSAVLLVWVVITALAMASVRSY